MNNPDLVTTVNPAGTFSNVTLRDLFAGLAMQAIITRQGTVSMNAIAIVAYEQANAMLIERERELT